MKMHCSLTSFLYMITLPKELNLLEPSDDAEPDYMTSEMAESLPLVIEPSQLKDLQKFFEVPILPCQNTVRTKGVGTLRELLLVFFEKKF